MALTDFEFKKLRCDTRRTSVDITDSYYRDPNTFKDLKLSASEEGDIYSMGILMWEVWNCKIPFEECEWTQVTISFFVLVVNFKLFNYSFYERDVLDLPEDVDHR